MKTEAAAEPEKKGNRESSAPQLLRDKENCPRAAKVRKHDSSSSKLTGKEADAVTLTAVARRKPNSVEVAGRAEVEDNSAAGWSIRHERGAAVACPQSPGPTKGERPLVNPLNGSMAGRIRGTSRAHVQSSATDSAYQL